MFKVDKHDHGHWHETFSGKKLHKFILAQIIIACQTSWVIFSAKHQNRQERHNFIPNMWKHKLCSLKPWSTQNLIKIQTISKLDKISKSVSNRCDKPNSFSLSLGERTYVISPLTSKVTFYKQPWDSEQCTLFSSVPITPNQEKKNELRNLTNLRIQRKRVQECEEREKRVILTYLAWNRSLQLNNKCTRDAKRFTLCLRFRINYHIFLWVSQWQEQ